jgi:hypothetical protein
MALPCCPKSTRPWAWRALGQRGGELLAIGVVARFDAKPEAKASAACFR